jgi:quinol monooxygenase YgiN
MTQKLCALLLTLIITAAWLGKSVAQQPQTSHVLRVYTTSVLPEKRDQLPTVVHEMTQLLAATKAIQWFTVGSDPATGEIVAVTLWKSQADIDAFLTSEARKAAVEKTKALTKGDPTAKYYQVMETKK